MPKLTNEDLLKNLDFTCARCQAECTKINAAEPEHGYISKVDGSFVGPICSNCLNQIPEPERQTRNPFPETAFLIVIRPNGEGAFMTTEGVGLTYLREPTFLDVMQGCERVKKDVEESIFAQKLTNQIMHVVAASQKAPKIMVPR